MLHIAVNEYKMNNEKLFEIQEKEKKYLKAEPFLKWAGGKRQIIKEIKKYIPRKFNTYYEPFIGAGAVFFEIKPQNCVISDINKDLINTYLVIKNNVDELIEDLKKYKNEKSFYYYIRNFDRTTEFNKIDNIKRASRFIFLNKTCYNGLYRVNSKGQFNVPFGKYKKPNIVNEEVLRNASIYLNNINITILNIDFELTTENADDESFIYLDPPYYPISNSSSFTSYTNNGFNWDEQMRLKKACDILHNKGCKFLLSNSAHKLVINLYKEYKCEIIKAGRYINSVSTKRGKINEILVRNYE